MRMSHQVSGDFSVKAKVSLFCPTLQTYFNTLIHQLTLNQAEVFCCLYPKETLHIVNHVFIIVTMSSPESGNTDHQLLP